MKNKGYQAWLGYRIPAEQPATARYGHYLGRLVTSLEGRQGPGGTACAELLEGIEASLGRRPQILGELDANPALVIGVLGETAELGPDALGMKTPEVLPPEGYRILTVRGQSGGPDYIALAGGSESGLLYGAFHFLRLLRTGAGLETLDIREAPRNRLRMINQWDNMDGSVERGYAGRSIFYKDGQVLAGSQRIRDYARLLASVGINGISINNVNVHRTETLLLTELYLPDVARVAAVFRDYGIRLYLSVNYAGPLELGDTDTADPLDPSVRSWWQAKAAEVYRYVPDFGGFLVKADSENRPGPFTYGRDHADGANMLAGALEPYGGIVLWRCFVYNCHQDWRDRMTDRARAAYDHFKPLDGRFKDNVILQIKNGPMDFQVREPVSPLFGAMAHTNQVMEFQITQEYTGQQKHVCYLVPQWKQVLDFDTRLAGEGSTVKRIAAGEVYPYAYSGFAAVSNIGDDANWTGHHLAQANLYGYGRLIWNPELEAEEIADEWTRLTFGPEPAVLDTVKGFLMESWPIYEKLTSPLGVGWMVTPHYHYGPDVDGYEYSKWGTYHFSDCRGMGVDRTVATGTGYTGQYTPEVGAVYEDLETCPDELLLFFHHVPYTHRLKSGKTVIQHIYDTHFEGVELVEKWRSAWLALEGKVDAERFSEVRERLDVQLESACQWRDVINTYFYRKSGIPDAGSRTIY
ncbi:alpha-glucuronidase family glycosyl hydrolase [Gorillibacterium sp. sgz5001074]|uniref:alpha-glucuronidase family glycosyl hydrolase n=1 Tax=Gorillibacterium sp. sgz5001074 TaxID=3446695 RepID=UPI003F668D29